MAQIEHQHKDGCTWADGGYIHFLVAAAPDVLWYNVQDVGSYQGSVYAVGKYQKKILIYKDYYGSCSGCGAWGEGGEPTNQIAVLAKSSLFATKEEAITDVQKDEGYSDPPNQLEMINAINEIQL